MKDTILIEQRGDVALLLRPTAVERYVVARDYQASRREWYGGGLYFKDLRSALDCFERITSND